MTDVEGDSAWVGDQPDLEDEVLEAQSEGEAETTTPTHLRAGTVPDAEVRLLAGEQVSFGHSARSPTELTDDEISEKYSAGEVRIVTEQARYPLSTIASMVASDDYDLNPEFQRRHRWPAVKQSRLIESFIMNVPVPPIFLYEDEYSHYEVMDGLQRLTAIAAFYNNKLALTGLTEWVELEGRTYEKLPLQVRKGIDRRYLSSIILLRETAKSPAEAERLKQLVFERINSGGERLKEQETRNAIYNGPLNKLCIRLSRDEHLCRLWGIPPKTQAEIRGEDIPPALEKNKYYSTMFDVELVLRFFAHRQRKRIGGGALRTFLDNYLKQGNLFPAPTLLELGTLFEQTIALVDETLGPQAFWLWRFRHGHWGWLERPTTSAYDAFMFVFSKHLDDQERLLSLKNELRAAIPVFYEEHVDSFDARMTNMSNIRERDALVEGLITSVLDHGVYVKP